VNEDNREKENVSNKANVSPTNNLYRHTAKIYDIIYNPTLAEWRLPCN